MSANLPDSFFYILGVLVVMSAGSLIAAVGLMFRVAIWVGEFKQRMLAVEKDNNAAHEKIRAMEKEKCHGD